MSTRFEIGSLGEVWSLQQAIHGRGARLSHNKDISTLLVGSMGLEARRPRDGESTNHSQLGPVHDYINCAYLPLLYQLNIIGHTNSRLVSSFPLGKAPCFSKLHSHRSPSSVPGAHHGLFHSQLLGRLPGREHPAVSLHPSVQTH